MNWPLFAGRAISSFDVCIQLYFGRACRICCCRRCRATILSGTCCFGRWWLVHECVRVSIAPCFNIKILHVLLVLFEATTYDVVLRYTCGIPSVCRQNPFPVWLIARGMLFGWVFSRACFWVSRGVPWVKEVKRRGAPSPPVVRA